MHKIRRLRAGSSWTAYNGMMWVCCRRASVRCSHPSAASSSAPRADCQASAARQVDASLGTASNSAEGRNYPALGPGGPAGARRIEQLMALQQFLQRFAPLWKPAKKRRCRRRFADLLTEAHFLIDQSKRRVGIFLQVRMPVEIFLRARPFTRLPAPDHLLGQLAREIAAAVRFVWPENSGRHFEVHGRLLVIPPRPPCDGPDRKKSGGRCWGASGSGRQFRRANSPGVSIPTAADGAADRAQHLLPQFVGLDVGAGLSIERRGRVIQIAHLQAHSCSSGRRCWRRRSRKRLRVALTRNALRCAAVAKRQPASRKPTTTSAHTDWTTSSESNLGRSRGDSIRRTIRRRYGSYSRNTRSADASSPLHRPSSR